MCLKQTNKMYRYGSWRKYAVVSSGILPFTLMEKGEYEDKPRQQEINQAYRQSKSQLTYQERLRHFSASTTLLLGH